MDLTVFFVCFCFFYSYEEQVDQDFFFFSIMINSTDKADVNKYSKY